MVRILTVVDVRADNPGSEHLCELSSGRRPGVRGLTRDRVPHVESHRRVGGFDKIDEVLRLARQPPAQVLETHHDANLVPVLDEFLQALLGAREHRVLVSAAVERRMHGQVPPATPRDNVGRRQELHQRLIRQRLVEIRELEAAERKVVAHLHVSAGKTMDSLGVA